MTPFNISGNLTYCDYMDNTFDAIMDMKRESVNHMENVSGIFVSFMFILVSLISMLFGGKLFRWIASMTSAMLVFYVSYKFTKNSEGLTCDTRIFISGILGIVAFFMTGCMINFALFVLGAASFGGFVHLIFGSFPQLHTVLDVPTIASHSLTYWASMVIMCLLGGLLFKWNRQSALEFMTSIIGGCGFVYGIHGLLYAANVIVDRIIFVFVALVASTVGIVFQRKFRTKKLCKKKTREEKREGTKK